MNDFQMTKDSIVTCQSCGVESDTVGKCRSCDNEHCENCTTLTDCPICGDDVCDGCETECSQCGQRVCPDCVKRLDFQEYCVTCHGEILGDMDREEEMAARRIDYYMDMVKDREYE